VMQKTSGRCYNNPLLSNKRNFLFDMVALDTGKFIRMVLNGRMVGW